MKALAALLLLATLTYDPQEIYEPAVAHPQHRWLQQLVGEWQVSYAAPEGAQPEAKPLEFRESVRAIGDLWIVGEGQCESEGKPMTSILTLGYDPDEKAFVGTWIDSNQTHMWVYRGSLDSTGKVLTLESEGPSFADPSRKQRFRDVITLESGNHRTLTSSMRDPDGNWATFMRADYRRRQ